MVRFFRATRIYVRGGGSNQELAPSPQEETNSKSQIFLGNLKAIFWEFLGFFFSFVIFWEFYQSSLGILWGCMVGGVLNVWDFFGNTLGIYGSVVLI